MPTLNTIPGSKRPRERLLEHGPTSLSLEELLAVVIGTGGGGSDVLTTSQALAEVLIAGRASIAALMSVRGVGLAKALEVCAALHIGDALAQRSDTATLSDPEVVFGCMSDVRVLPQEHLVVFYLTARHGQIARDVVSVGTATASLVHPREVFRPAILANAAHIVLAHTHPSGDPTPSQADYLVTRRMAEAGRMIGIALLDHLICARESYISLQKYSPELFS